MQSIQKHSNNNEHIVGIRYFSCSSVLASEMGFNYVFPAVLNDSSDCFSLQLRKTFPLTDPLFLEEYSESRYFEIALINKNVDYLAV